MANSTYTLQFAGAFDRLIGNEGGYSNNPKDPGGETMWGVTKKVARAHGYMGEMKDLPRNVAMEIAYKSYWTPLQLDLFHPKIAFEVFDAFYNGGHPVMWMQSAAGAKVDGIIGPETIAKVKGAGPLAFCLRFLSLRLLYFTALKNWPTFGRGWANRVAHNMDKASR